VSKDRLVKLWDAETGRLLRTLPRYDGRSPIQAIAFSPDGGMLASGSVDRTVRLWKISGEPIVTLTGHLAEVTKVAFTPDGRTLVSVDERGTAAVTHVATRQTMFELPTPAERIQGVAISPNSRRMASGAEVIAYRPHIRFPEPLPLREG